MKRITNALADCIAPLFALAAVVSFLIACVIALLLATMPAAHAAPPLPHCWPLPGGLADNINYGRVAGVGRWWAWTCPDGSWASVWVTDAWANTYTNAALATAALANTGNFVDMWAQIVKDEGGTVPTAKLKAAAKAYIDSLPPAASAPK